VRFVLTGIEKVTGGVGVATAWLIVPMIFATVYEVIARYVFGAPTIWAFEVAYMAMGAHFLMGSAYTLRERAHVRIDVAYIHFPPRVRALVDVIGYGCLFIPFGVWISYRLALFTWGAYESGETSGASAWNPVIWPFRLTFLVGFVLLTLQGVVELSRSVRVLVRGGES